MPPTYSGSASCTVTSAPPWASRYAAVRPAGPAPITATRGVVSGMTYDFNPSHTGEDKPLAARLASGCLPLPQPRGLRATLFRQVPLALVASVLAALLD